MNFNDFTTGQLVANSANRGARADADDAIGEWKAYCNQLKSKLADAEKNSACCVAREAGRDAQQKILRDALANLSPNHPLLKQLSEIGGRAMAESFARNGYDYDPTTEVLRKR